MYEKLKKKRGSAGIFAASLIAMMILSFLFIFFIDNIRPIKTRIDAGTICRKYALTLEQQGYLTPENQSKVVSDFNNIGIKNVDLTGTTMSQVQYGDDVCLNVVYTDKIKTITIGRSLIPSFQDKSITIPISKKTVSTKAHYHD